MTIIGAVVGGLVGLAVGTTVIALYLRGLSAGAINVFAVPLALLLLVGLYLGPNPVKAGLAAFVGAGVLAIAIGVRTPSVKRRIARSDHT